MAVVAAALMVRGTTAPWNVASLQRILDRQAFLPAFTELSKAMGMAQKNKDERRLEELKSKLTDFHHRTRFSPFQGMSYMFCCQLPQFALAFAAVRGMLVHPDLFRALAETKTLWLDSLLLPDPYCILPVISALGVLGNAELNAPAQPKDAPPENEAYFRFVIRGASLLFVPATSLLPSALLLFIATNTMYTAAAMYAFRRFIWQPPKIEKRWFP